MQSASLGCKLSLKSKQAIKRPCSTFHRVHRCVQPWLHRQVITRAPRTPAKTCDFRMLTTVVLLDKDCSTDCELVNAHESIGIIFSHIIIHHNLANEHFGVDIGLQTHRHRHLSHPRWKQRQDCRSRCLTNTNKHLTGLQMKTPQDLEVC